jgi:MerR family copper efflux transcriptional regulator
MTTPTEDVVQIGVLAERVGLSLRTVRYYEEVGLVVPSTRSKGGFRLYTTDQEHRLLIIKQMKPLGFTLEQMRELLDALEGASRSTPRSPEATRIAVTLSSLLAEVHERRSTLKDQLAAADRLAGSLAQASSRLWEAP